MPRFAVEIRELRLRFETQPVANDKRAYQREVRWEGDADNEDEARKRALVAWLERHGVRPEQPFTVEVGKLDAERRNSG